MHNLGSDEDETSNPSMQLVDEDSSVMKKGKVTNAVINSWCELVKKDSESALVSLLNVYRAACHYGTESIGVPETASCQIIQNSETFCSILMFMLCEVDNIFRGLLKISSSSCKKEVILELKNTSKWKSLKPLIKSYLRSTLFLLNQVTDSEILAFSLSRLRASIIFFAAFPSLLHRLIKVTVHLWASADGVLSSCSFLVIQNVAVVFTSDFFDICLRRTYMAYIVHSKVVDSINTKHVQFLRNSFVELCSVDVHKSCTKALLSIQKLYNILKQALRTKNKEGLDGQKMHECFGSQMNLALQGSHALLFIVYVQEAMKKICSWQYINCIDLWVMFISANVRDYELHHIFYLIIQLINGVACLFPGPRYFPLRKKCIQWLNHLSNSSGIFIPVSSLVLDVLEYKMAKEGGKPGKICNFSSVLKWSYHISFPEVATIPLIFLRKFPEVATTENQRRMVKRLIDQMEQNIEFVQKKRDEVAFSPNEHQSVESFLQLEKCSLNAPFTQYYRSVMQKAFSWNLDANGIKSSLEHKKTKRKRGLLSKKVVNESVNSETETQR
ncbi:hypothetical protein U1Q18_047282 [Sarracenia purpurea var. burkii]